MEKKFWSIRIVFYFSNILIPQDTMISCSIFLRLFRQIVFFAFLSNYLHHYKGQLFLYFSRQKIGFVTALQNQDFRNRNIRNINQPCGMQSYIEINCSVILDKKADGMRHELLRNSFKTTNQGKHFLCCNFPNLPDPF